MKRVDTSKQCARCLEYGHRFPECTRIRHHQLPKLQCYACGCRRETRQLLASFGWDKAKALAAIDEWESGPHTETELIRRHVAWSDWPYDAAFVMWGRVDPLDEEKRQEAWR